MYLMSTAVTILKIQFIKEYKNDIQDVNSKHFRCRTVRIDFQKSFD